tara:strand:+ start:129 stop:569 length:441 start_codon:yes stop_codon:yes gene_type:complete
METFKRIKVGDEYVSTTSISNKELEEYLGFSRIKNAMFEINSGKNEPKMISGRAIIARMEGEFTRLRQIYGNQIVLYGIDGDPEWNNRQTRFLKSLYTDEVIRIKYKISDKKELDEEFGLISVDFEATTEDVRLFFHQKEISTELK